jgi:hypothetical protein
VRRSIFLIIASGLIAILIFYFGVLNNSNLLIKIASKSESNSFVQLKIFDRIYTNVESKGLDLKNLDYILKGNDHRLKNCYIRVLGVVGAENASPIMITAYDKNKNNPNEKSTLYYLIKSLGIIGDKSAIPFMEALLIEYHSKKTLLHPDIIAESLYLLTGDHDYYNMVESNKGQEHELSGEQIEARSVILMSASRRRTFKEMKILDKLYRPQR